MHSGFESLKRTKITIIQVYPPTEASSEEELEEFYDKLDEMIDKYRSHLNFVIETSVQSRAMNSRRGKICRTIWHRYKKWKR